MGAGRPSLYEDRYCDEIVAFMGCGYSKTAFAGSIGVCRDTILEWSAAHPEFSGAVKRGEAARTQRLEETLIAGATGPKVTAHIFALKNAAPDEWRDKHEVEHGITGDLAAILARIDGKTRNAVPTFEIVG